MTSNQHDRPVRELAVITFITLDGVMQSPNNNSEDSSRGFTSGGWAIPCWDQVMAQVAREAMSVPYDILLGRRTYDIFEAAHGSTEGAAENRMTAATKYVVTSEPNSITWANTTPLTGDIQAEISRLKRHSGPLLQVHGSWQLVQSLIAHDLIDEYRIWTFPAVAGNGKRLFEKANAFRRLTLSKSARAGDSGATMSIYRRAKSR